MKNLDKIIDVAENLGWAVSQDNDYICFQQYSPEGQDFYIEVGLQDAPSIVEEVVGRYENYDVCYETYIWLDSDGHGQNGAPYDMKDLYEDMVACKEMLEELSAALQNIEFEEE